MPTQELQGFFALIARGCRESRRQGRRLANAAQPGGCRGAHRARGQGVRLWSATCAATGKLAGFHSFLLPAQADGLPERLLDAVLAEQRRDWIAGKRIPADEVCGSIPSWRTSRRMLPS